MTKKYQINEFDTSALAVPARVSVAMDEITADMREGLLALAVGAGLQVMTQLMEADVPRSAARRAGTTRTGLRSGMAPRPGRSRWVGAGCRCAARGPVRSMAPGGGGGLL